MDVMGSQCVNPRRYLKIIPPVRKTVTNYDDYSNSDYQLMKNTINAIHTGGHSVTAHSHLKKLWDAQGGRPIETPRKRREYLSAVAFAWIAMGAALLGFSLFTMTPATLAQKATQVQPKTQARPAQREQPAASVRKAIPAALARNDRKA
jgi:hypothetical protein